MSLEVQGEFETENTSLEVISMERVFKAQNWMNLIKRSREKAVQRTEYTSLQCQEAKQMKRNQHRDRKRDQ